MKHAGKRGGIVFVILFLVSFGWTVGAYAVDESGDCAVSCRIRPTTSVTVSSGDVTDAKSVSIVVKSNRSWTLVVYEDTAAQAPVLGLAVREMNSPFTIKAAAGLAMYWGEPGITRMIVPLRPTASGLYVYSASQL